MAGQTPGHLLLLLGLCCTLVQASYPLKILGLFPHPAISHFHFFHPIMRGLAEKGHDVTVLSHFPDKSPTARYRDLPLTRHETLTNSVDLKFFETEHFYDHFGVFFLVHEWGKNACNLTLRSDALAQVLRQRQHFDVIIMEQFNSDCMTAVAHQLKAPFIGLSSCAMTPWHYERVGMPMIPSVMPAVFMGQSEDMTFGARLANWFTDHTMRFLYDNFNTPAIDAMVREKFGQNTPSVAELAKKTSMLFVNQHFSLSGVKPLPPSVIDLGGIHIQKAKPLDPELQKFLDNAEHGVVFISWGSMIRADTLPPAKREAIVRAVMRLKQRVIWKWENSTLANKPDNLYVSNWLPQRDILCHPNVKVFLSHGGLMGSSEAAYCGVPVVVTPMYGDQFVNAAVLKYRGMGVVLKYGDITENSVLRSIREVLKKQYMDNAKAVSFSYRHRPQSALETAIWWVEYVAKTEGAPLLKAHAVQVSRFVYYSLDIYLFIAAIIFISVVSWSFICSRWCSRRPKAAKQKSN
ncbi:UDP-glucosyltransferase 2-like [Bactrocera dorsalis]|uniref:UDP-glucuronosyltransferase n=1 Tax=Bactrocera dorsalis TaxID=27457 RepID=A0ABM3JL36_BACDO|nr:UDP-glucosyltransferase 2-like [Bactrocera dorsalis]XP_049309942.1 UDP-glucosyltransferase 2-like [Bactrocera dorsalis]XP_049309943.1 UDP-glucosyltransferase 2-like [Bactrocera dorsalis]XP_049309944.1 UDP-glucosyltransferase 2-like [Bactrocera dorsalis]